VIDAVLFYAFAVLALGSALVVVGQRNPLYSAFALIVTLCSLSAIFGLLGSPFIAVLQVVVYAGAIMVLFLFVLMLLNVKQEEAAAPRGAALKGMALLLVAILVAQVGTVLSRGGREAAASFDASTRKVAQALFSVQYLYVFEATSILILAALVGAVALAKPSDAGRGQAKPGVASASSADEVAATPARGADRVAAIPLPPVGRGQGWGAR
jgi:NADH-quinone oxidoreductase subunit J